MKQFSPPSAVQHCIQFLILGTAVMMIFLLLAVSWQHCFFFLLSFFLPVSPLHFSSKLNNLFVLNQIHLQSSLYFILMLSCCQKVLYTATNGQCECMSVSERLKVCVYVISFPAAPRNNCPERSLCLVMACCYLTPCCAEKK